MKRMRKSKKKTRWLAGQLALAGQFSRWRDAQKRDSIGAELGWVAAYNRFPTRNASASTGPTFDTCANSARGEKKRDLGLLCSGALAVPEGATIESG